LVIRAVQRSIHLSEWLSLHGNTLGASCLLAQVADSGAANYSNLCAAMATPIGCHAIVRSSALLSSFFAVVIGGISYRSIVTFIKVIAVA